MMLMSLAGLKVNGKAFELDKEMFKINATSKILIIAILMILIALYVKFW